MGIGGGGAITGSTLPGADGCTIVGLGGRTRVGPDSGTDVVVSVEPAPSIGGAGVKLASGGGVAMGAAAGAVTLVLGAWAVGHPFS